MKKFVKMNWKHLLCSSFSLKLLAWVCKFTKKNTPFCCIPVDFTKFFMDSFFKEQLRLIAFVIRPPKIGCLIESGRVFGIQTCWEDQNIGHHVATLRSFIHYDQMFAKIFDCYQKKNYFHFDFVLFSFEIIFLYMFTKKEENLRQR